MNIAVGSIGFVEKVKSLMGALAIDRKSIGGGEPYQLRKPPLPYWANFATKNGDIEPQNNYYWVAISQ